MSTSRYEQRGVSADKSEVHEAIRNLDKGLFPNAFCKILPDIIGKDPAFCNLIHADTAGTKSVLAYLFCRETGDHSVWAGIAQDALVMNLDDMACVGCVDGFVISSTIGRNKKLIDGKVLSSVIEGAENFLADLRRLGVEIFSGGGETADVGDVVRTLDVGYTAFARMPQNQLIVNEILPGDVVVGFASYGRSAYERQYNSGIGCNGLTSARHDVLSKFYAEWYPESFDPALSAGLVYSGSRRLTDSIEINGEYFALGRLLLSPTRTYLPLIRRMLLTHRRDIHGMIHCTGGGQTKVMKFLQGCKVIKDNLFPVPNIFQIIQSESTADWREMYQVFNMGHRLEVYTSPEIAPELIKIAEEFNIEAQQVGYVSAAEVPSVHLKTVHGAFEYYS